MKHLEKLKTSELAFNLALGTYSEEEKWEVLKIIKNREDNGNSKGEGGDPAGDIKPPTTTPSSPATTSNKKKPNPPLPKSKAEAIKKLKDAGKTRTQALAIIQKKYPNTHYPEVDRVYKRYADE